MIGHQQAAAGIAGLKQSLQPPEGVGAELPADVVAPEQAEQNGKELELAPKAENPAAASLGDNAEAGEPEKKEDGDNEEDDEGEPPIDMKFPSGQGWKKILLYLISFPLMAPLYVTLPDTKDSKSKLSVSNRFN